MVVLRRNAEAVELQLRRAIRYAVLIGVRHELSADEGVRAPLARTPSYFFGTFSCSERSTRSAVSTTKPPAASVPAPATPIS